MGSGIEIDGRLTVSHQPTMDRTSIWMSYMASPAFRAEHRPLRPGHSGCPKN